MKKIISFILLFVLTTFGCQAQILSQKIKLSDDHTSYVVKKLNGVDITVSREQGSGDDMFDVTIEIDNQRGEGETLCLFDKSYTEKELKKRRPTSVRFDKYLMAGEKGHRSVKPCQELPEAQMIEWDNKIRLMSLSVEKNISKVVKLHIYIAKYKNKKRKKLILLDEKELELEIAVEGGKSAPMVSTFPRLEASCDSLLRELKEKGPFCRNPKHTPRLKDAEQPFKEIIEQLTEEVERYARNEGGEQWKALKEKLDIDFGQHEYDCGTHKNSDPRPCLYSDMSLYEILKAVTKIYNDASIGKSRDSVGDRKKIEAMYTCAKQHKHKNRVKDENNMNKITEYYKRFKRL